MNFQVGELGSVSTIFQDRGQEKALPHRQKSDRAVRVVAEPRCCSSDGSDVLADWRADSRGGIVGWRDGRIARWMVEGGTGGWAARCEAVGSTARTKRRTGRRKARAGIWSVEREAGAGPEAEAAGWRAIEGLRAAVRAAAGWWAGVFSLGRGAGRARGDNRWSAGKGDAGQFWAANEAAKFEILCTTLFVAVGSVAGSSARRRFRSKMLPDGGRTGRSQD